MSNHPIYLCIICTRQTHKQDSWDHERHFHCQDKSGNINASELRHVLSSSELALSHERIQAQSARKGYKKTILLLLFSIVLVHFSTLCPYKSSFASMLRQALGYQPMRVVIHEVLQEALGHLMSQMVQAFLLSEESTIVETRGTHWSTDTRNMFRSVAQIPKPTAQVFLNP